MNSFHKVTFVLILAIATMSCENESKVKERFRPVKYEEVSFKGGVRSRSFTGSTQSGSEINLSFRLNGLIVKLEAHIGDRVRKGAVLARLDVKDVELSRQKANARVQSAKIVMDNTKSDLERTKQLYRSQSVSLDRYENAKTAFANASSSYETALRELDLVQSQFEYSTIRSPLTGVVSAVHSEINEFVQAGQTILVMDSEDANIEINVGIPETFISQIRQGDNVEATINDKVVSGTISEVGYSASGAAVFPVIIKLDKSDDDLRPGMPATTTFTFGSAEVQPVLTVPVYAVGEDEQGNYVMLLETTEDSSIYQVKKTSIEVGELTNDGFKVVEGLSEGQKIATGGLHILLNNQKVKLL